MEEYRRLSKEIEGSLTRRLQVLEFGLALIGVMTGFGLMTAQPSSHSSHFVSTVVGVLTGSGLTKDKPGPYLFLTIGVPASCFMILVLWLSEVRRTRRASWYLWGLERRIHDLLGSRVLCWEGDIRESKKQALAVFRFHYYTTAAFFILAATLEAAYGMYVWDTMPMFIRILSPLSLLIVMSTITVYVLRRLQKYDTPGLLDFRPDSDFRGHNT